MWVGVLGWGGWLVGWGGWWVDILMHMASFLIDTEVFSKSFTTRGWNRSVPTWIGRRGKQPLLA